MVTQNDESQEVGRPPNRCDRCDAELLEDDRFCPACGNKLEQQTATESAPPATMTPHGDSPPSTEEAGVRNFGPPASSSSQAPDESRTGAEHVNDISDDSVEMSDFAIAELTPEPWSNSTHPVATDAENTNTREVSADELQRRLDAAVQQFAAGNISASMLGRIETEISLRIEQAESARGPIHQSPGIENPSGTQKDIVGSPPSRQPSQQASSPISNPKASSPGLVSDAVFTRSDAEQAPVSESLVLRTTPESSAAGSGKNRIAWVFGALAACAVVLVLIFALGNRRSSDDAGTTGASDDEFVGDGGLGPSGLDDDSIRLLGAMISETATARDGLECRGTGPTYPGIDVSVSNGAGRTIGYGVTRSILDYEIDGFDNMTPQDVRLRDDATEFLINGEGCVVAFEVWVEPSETYNLDIFWGNQGAFTYTQTELETRDWYLSFDESGN